MLRECSASLTIGGLQFSQSHGAASVGTCVHAIIENAIVCGGVNDDFIEAAIIEHCIPDSDHDEVRVLAYVGWRIWNEEILPVIGDGDIETEVPMQHEFSGVTLTGHADVVVIYEVGGRPHALVVDWKTGRLQSDYMAQLNGYAALVAKAYPHVDSVTAVAVYVRDGEFRKITRSRPAAVIWATETLAGIKDRSGKFQTGDHCQYCPASTNCPALKQMMVAAVSWATSANIESESDLFSDENAHRIAAAYDATRLLKKAVDAFERGLKLHIEANGDVEFGDGRIATNSVSMLDAITDTRKAWPVLMEYVGEKGMLECVNIQIGKAKKAAREATPEGTTKKANEKAMLDALHEAGALKQTPQTRLQVKKA